MADESFKADPGSFTVDALKTAVVAHTRYTGYKRQVAEEAAELTVKWWQERGYFKSYSFEWQSEARNRQELHAAACHFVRENMETEVQGVYKFIFIAFLLEAILSAIISWVVRLILDYWWRNKPAAVAFHELGSVHDELNTA